MCTTHCTYTLCTACLVLPTCMHYLHKPSTSTNSTYYFASSDFCMEPRAHGNNREQRNSGYCFMCH